MGAPLYYLSYLNGERAPYVCGTCEGNEGIFNRRVLATIDATAHRTKPQNAEVGATSNRLLKSQPCLTRPERLAKAISKGCAFLPSVHDGKRSPETWRAQQLFCIDVDNDVATRKRCGRDLPYTEAVMRAGRMGLPLLITYESFSSTDANERYRLVFALEEPTRDRGRAEAFGSALLAAYPEADRSSTELNRLFFGTNKEVLLWNRPLL